MKILLIQNGSISEAVCSTPAIEALRKAYPKAQIDILVNDYNECVVRHNPFVNKVLIYHKAKKNDAMSEISAFSSRFQTKSKIWNHKYNTTVIFSNKFYKRDVGFAEVSGAKQIIGVDDYNRSQLITEKISYNNNHEVQFCFDLLSPLGVKYNGEKTLFIPDEAPCDYPNYVFFHISARKLNDHLSSRKIEQIIGFLKAKFKVVITSNEIRLARLLSKQTGCPFLQTKTIMELASQLIYAKFLVAPYGGVAHLGPTLGVRTLGIFGSTNMNRFSPTYGKAKCIILNDRTGIAENVENRKIFETIIKEFAD